MSERNDLQALSQAVANVAILVDDFDGHDPWGSAMHVWFECAEHLAQRGEDVPTEWEFRQGADADELDELFSGYSPDYLRLLGNRAMELSSVCKRLGLDY